MPTADSLRALPKVQLHCHLEGTLRATSFIDLARRHGVALHYDPQNPALGFEEPPKANEVYRFSDFRAFLMTFAAVCRSLAEPGDYARLASEYVEDALAERVAYAELFISPSVWRFFHPLLDLRACVRAMAEVFAQAERRGIEVRLIVDLTRNFGVESAMKSAKDAVAWRDLRVVGIGLGGDEARFPAALFVKPFAYARANGLHCVAHAGEAAGAQSVRDAVELLGAERIGHGIRALENADVLRLLAERGIALEVCPTSNFLTGVAARAQPHPFQALDAAGCVVTIDADDPALFETSISQEYAFVVRQAGNEALLRFVRNGVNASFTTAAQKAELHRRLGEPSTTDVRT